MTFDQNYSGEFNPAAEEQQVYQNQQQEASEESYSSEEISVNPENQSFSKQELNFKALREEVDRLKAERESEKREYQFQMEMIRANMNQAQVPRQEEATRKMFEGMSDDDIPTVSELRKEWEQRESNYQERIEEMQVQQNYPDYAEVLEKYTAPLIKQKPHLAAGIRGADNKALFAYELGKMAQQAIVQQSTPPQSENAKRILENSRKPGTLSSAGGRSALSQTDYYASMSDAEFIKFAGRHLNGI